MKSLSSRINKVIKEQDTTIFHLSKKLKIESTMLRRFISNTDKQLELLKTISIALNHNFLEDANLLYSPEKISENENEIKTNNNDEQQPSPI